MSLESNEISKTTDAEEEGGDDDRRDHPVERDARCLHRRDLVFGGELAESHERRGHHGHWND